MTKTQDLVKAYGAGQATADDVIGAVKAGALNNIAYTSAGDDFEALMNAEQTDSAETLNLDGWDAVVKAYGEGDITGDQFAALYRLYVG